MSIYHNNKKAKLLFINGSDVKKAYLNGKLIFQKNNIPCYGFLTYNDTKGKEIVQPIINSSDYALLSKQTETGSATKKINFSFGTVLQGNITGWEFNTDSKTSYVTTTIPANFLRALPALNCDIVIPSWVTNIGNDFISGGAGSTWGITMTFNGKITIKNSNTIIGNNFLYQLPSFNNEIINAENIKTIGNGFLASTKFDKDLYLTNVTSIGDNFLKSGVFNSRLSLDKVESIGNEFMSSQRSFNSDINLGNYLKSIGIRFMENNRAFNRPLILPNTIKTIGGTFLRGCHAFNQDLTIPSGCTISGSMLTGELSSSKTNYSATLTFEENSAITGSFLTAMKSGCTPTIIVDTDVANIASSDSSLSYSVSKLQSGDVTYVGGTYATEFMAKFPNNNKRNLVAV